MRPVICYVQSPFVTVKCSDALIDRCFNRDKFHLLFWHTCVCEYVSTSMRGHFVSKYSSGRFIRVGPW